MSDRTYLSIGQVLDLLKREFPDLTISKIRFLESQGLLDPERTPSGYRKFYEPDIERLRFILHAQQEHYLPLKVIKGRLGTEGAEPEAAEPEGDAEAPGAGPPGAGPPGARAGAEAAEAGRVGARAAAERHPAAAAGATAPAGSGAGASGAGVGGAGASGPGASGPGGPAPAGRGPTGAGAAPPGRPVVTPPRPDRPPAPEPAPRRGAANGAPKPSGSRFEVVGKAAEAEEPVSMTLEELADASGLAGGDVTDLERYGLLSGRRMGGTMYYDDDCLEIAQLAAAFRDFGVEARHLRMYRTAVEREAGFFEQVVTPMLKQRNPQARRQAVDTLLEMSRLGQSLRAAVLRQALRDYTGS